jgi:hypothetical protein
MRCLPLVKAISSRFMSYGMKRCSLIDRFLIIIFGMVERTLIGLKSEIKVAETDLGVREILAWSMRQRSSLFW